MRGALLSAAFLFMPFAPALAQDNGTVVLASYGSVWQEALEKALKPFEAENKVKVRFTAGSSTDNVARAIAARNRPDVDVVMGEEMTFGQGRGEGIFEKLDPAIVKNLANIVPEAKMGEEGVGVIMQAIGFFYRTDVFQKNGWAPPSSWNDLLDKKFCHQLRLEPSERVVLLLHADDARRRRARRCSGRRAKGRRHQGLHRHDRSERRQDGREGAARRIRHRHHGAPIDADAWRTSGAPLKYADPKEGAMLQFSTAAVTKNAPNPKMAQTLVNETPVRAGAGAAGRGVQCEPGQPGDQGAG